MNSAFTLRTLTCFALLSCVCLPAARAADATIQYNRDVRPILFENCFSCHGPDSASRQAELRLDKRDGAVEKKAIVPGNADASEMIRRILSDDADEQMPPPVTKKKLTNAQKKLLADWIKNGAEYQPHWSLIAPVRPPVPKVEKDAIRIGNPIDNFVAAKLESVGLTPAPEADRRTLARRVSLDLIGLPPSPGIVEEFVKDGKPDAYERLVDKLMTSPKWGEHRGRYWLDAARYGDTHGIHIDNYREIWSYRDWVIDAINKNMPFDQFTIENLAGDLLPNATLENRLGSGFNRCNITTSEGGAIDEEYQVLYTRDRVETTSKVWMGLTTGCAVCHDHKFDPFTQKEFYQLAAFFNNTTQKPMDGNIKNTPPIVMVPQKSDVARIEQLNKEIPESKKLVDDRRRDARKGFDEWLAHAKPEDVAGEMPSDLELFAPLDDGAAIVRYELRGQRAEKPLPPTAEWRPGRAGSKAAYLNQGAVLVVPEAGDYESNQQFSYSAWVKLPANDGSGAILSRMNEDDQFRGYDLWVEGRRVGAHIVNQWPANAVKVVTKEQLPADQWVHVAVTYDGTKKAAGVHVYVNGKPQPTNVQADTLTETIRTTVPFKIGQRNTTAPLSGASIQDVRLYARRLSDGDVASLARSTLSAIVAAPPEKRSPADVDSLYEWWLTSRDDNYQKLSKKHDELTREQADIQARSTSGYVMQEKPEAPVAFILNRGEYDQRKDQVAPGTPVMLPPFPTDLPHNRLGLAKWLLRPEHPLTARVTVNRFWTELFGTGLVRSAGDFGVSGELPSHPELLDWLAVEFRESGWDVKKLFKLIVMSATYRQSAVITKDKLEKDPDNLLLSRGPRFRMDAEMVRDYALSASGLLSEKIGGPSVKPYQPPGVWEAVAMIGSDTRNYKQDAGESLYRRSMYTFWKRTAPPASMDIFNAPSRETCTMSRDRTNTPLQALVTLNDPQFVEAARNLAQRAINSSDEQDHRLNFLAERLLARPLRSEELAIVRGSLEKFEKHYAAQADDAKKLLAVGESKAESKLPTPQLAAWTMVANELMNLDEVLNK